MNLHPSSETKYGLIIFSDYPSTKKFFTEEYPNDEVLKRLIDSIPKSSGGSVLEKALGEAKKVFAKGGRPEAKKVLVVFTDTEPTGKNNKTQENKK